MFKCTGDIVDNCNSNTKTVKQLRDAYNIHDHDVKEVQSGESTVTSEKPQRRYLMSDISSFWNIDEMQADWQENFGILTSDNDMRTAVLISLLQMALCAQMTHMRVQIAADGGAIWATRKQSVHVCGCCGEKN